MTATEDQPLLRLLATERQLDPERFARLQAVARSLRPGYPELEAFANSEIFSPQNAIRDVRRAQRRLRMVQTRDALAQLQLFFRLLDMKLADEWGDKKPTGGAWPPPGAM